MDESLFIMMLICGFLIFFALIYCFLSTCLGIQIRRADIWDALRPPSLSEVRRRDAKAASLAGHRTNRSRRGMMGAEASEEWEMNDLITSEGRTGVIERMHGGAGGGMEDWEMMKARTGMGRRGLF